MTSNPPTPTPVSQGDLETATPRTALQIMVARSQGHDGYVHAAFATVLEGELTDLHAELASLKQSILDLSHPNMRMLMADRDRAIAELVKCKEDGATELAFAVEENEFLQKAISAFDWQRINSMSVDEVEKELLDAGYTKERLDAGLAKIRATVEKALAARAASEPKP